jgi:hypothetical protein
LFIDFKVLRISWILGDEVPSLILEPVYKNVRLKQVYVGIYLLISNLLPSRALTPYLADFAERGAVTIAVGRTAGGHEDNTPP